MDKEKKFILKKEFLKKDILENLFMKMQKRMAQKLFGNQVKSFLLIQ
jgi:hypothetical protein